MIRRAGSLAGRTSTCAFALAFVVVLAPAAAGAQSPVAGENVNMVSGTTLLDGDPFLQRQNEPSIAVSTRGVNRLFAASNDYRVVDLPGTATNPDPTTDSWIGVYRSIDGGQTWKSRLVPGYPQQSATGPFPDPVGIGSPLRSYTAPNGVTYSYNAAADPTVRAGPDGLMLVSGMAFNRTTGDTALFVSRYLDDGTNVLNDQTSNYPEPFVYLDTDVATYGTNLDRPSLAIDVPRNTFKGATPQVCAATSNATGTTRYAGMAYMSYVQFSSTTNTSQVLVSTSPDCGVTWTQQPQLSSTQQLNQGTSIAIDPIDGTVWVAWRRVGSAGQPDAILLARSITQGNTFTPQQGVPIVTPSNGLQVFDLPGTPNQVRMLTLPSLAISVDNSGNRYLHLAWSQVGNASGDARVYTVTSAAINSALTSQKAWTTTASSNGWWTILGWSKPEPIDSPVGTANWSDPNDPAFNFTITQDEYGFPLPAPGLPHARGSQFMPAVTFGQGRLVVVYYDTRFDHARRYIDDATFLQLLGPVGQLDLGGGQLNLAAVFNTLADPASYQFDSSGNVIAVVQNTINNVAIPGVPWSWRHTAEVRVATAQMGNPTFDANGNPTFTSARVSDYAYGVVTVPSTDPSGTGGSAVFKYQATADSFSTTPIGVTVTSNGATSYARLGQTTANFIDLPLFRQGTFPFIGDYISVAGPALAPVAAPYPAWAPYGWAWNTGSAAMNFTPVSVPVFHAVWTSNQDVQPPPDGNWQNYTPVNLSVNGQPYTGSVFDPSGASGTPTFCPSPDPTHVGTRNQNVYTARISEGLYVFSPEPTKYVTNTARRTFVVAAQNVSGMPLTLQYCVSDSSGNCQSSFTPPSGVAAVSFADNLTTTGATPLLTSPTILAPVRSTVSQTLYVLGSGQNLVTPTLYVKASVVGCGPNLPAGATCPIGLSGIVTLNPPGSVPRAGDPYNGEVVQPVFLPFDASSDIGYADVSQASYTQASYTQASYTQASYTQASYTQFSLSDSLISQATYQLSNSGDTAVTYVVYLTGTTSTPLAMRITSYETVPTATGCSIVGVLNEVNQYSTGIYNNGGTGDTGAAVVTVLPHQTMLVTLSAPTSNQNLGAILSNVTVNAATQGSFANGTSTSAVSPLQITAPTALPNASTSPTPTAGIPFTVTGLAARGGVSPYYFSVVAVTRANGGAYSGSTLAASNPSSGSFLSGTIADGGDFLVTLKVTDSSSTPMSVTTTVPLHVLFVPSVSVSALPNPSIATQPVTFTAVLPAGATGTVSFADGTTSLGQCTLSAGTCSPAAVSGLAVGSHTVTASYGGDANYAAASGTTTQIVLNATSISLATSGTPSMPGAPVKFTATVASLGTGTTSSPTGTVTFYDGGAPLAVSAGVTNPCTLAATGTAASACSVTTSSLSSGSHSITATYTPDGKTFYAGSASSALSQFVLYPSTFTLTSTPNPSGVNQGVTFTATASASTIGATGTVTIVDTGTQTAVGSCLLLLNAASCSTTISTLSPGSHTLVASYSGDGTFAPSTSAPLVQVVLNGTTTTVTSSAAPAILGQSITFTATVSSTTTGTISGTVTFFDNGTQLGTPVTLGCTSKGCTATYSSSSLALGTHTISATYSGNTTFAGSSGSLTQYVIFSFNGFASPLSPAVSSPKGTGGASSFGTSSQSLGSTVAVKWKLQYYSNGTLTYVTSTGTALSITAYLIGATCPTTETLPATNYSQVLRLYTPLNGSGSSGNTFDSSGNTFTFSWSTSKPSLDGLYAQKGCYEFVVALSDGTLKAANIQF